LLAGKGATMSSIATPPTDRSTYREAEPVDSICDLPPQLLRSVLSARGQERHREDDPKDVNGEGPNINWETIADDARAHAISVVLFERLREIGYLERMSERTALHLAADSFHAKLQHLLQRED